MSDEYDLVILGAGPGGHAAAQRAAQYGIRVAIAEQNAVGGACVNRGCVPMEMLDSATSFARMYEDAASYGWRVDGSGATPHHEFNWARFSAIKDQEIARLNDVHTRSMVEAGAEFIRGQATLVDAHTVQVGDRRLAAKTILIAVGAKPVQPSQIQGIEQAITSREAFSIQQLPQRLLVIGGGYIGVGFASAFGGLGSQVTLINNEPLVLPGWDEEICQSLQSNLQQRGIRVFCNTTVKQIEQGHTGLQVMYSGSDSGTCEVDLVICAVGRAPCTEGLGLDRAGVVVDDQGAIVVDEQNRTSQPHIFAIGDCTNQHPALTPIATAQGRAFADTQFGNQPHWVSYDYIPAYIATRPQVAMVGLTEAAAREKYGDAIHCERKQFEPLFYKLTQRDPQTLMKLVINTADRDRIVGVHMIGDNAADIVQILAVSLRMGATRQELVSTIGIHPSIGEEILSF